MNTDPRGGRGRHGPATSGHWLAPLGRNTWYLAIVAVAVLGLTAGGVALLAQSGGAPGQAAPDCGLINCNASLPSPGPTISTQSHISKAHTTVSHAPASPKRPAPATSANPGTSAAPSQAPVPAAPPPANVSVSVTSSRNRHDFGHFQDQMTLVNNGGSSVSGWTVQLTLPGDGVDSVETQAGRDGVPFEHWQFRGDTLTISADTDSETLGPGTLLSLSIQGRGNMGSPTGCTFNGSACPTLGQQDPPGPQNPGAGLQFLPVGQPLTGQQDSGQGQQGQRGGQRRFRQQGQPSGAGQPRR